jgi:hypothetical protein
MAMEQQAKLNLIDANNPDKLRLLVIDDEELMRGNLARV